MGVEGSLGLRPKETRSTSVRGEEIVALEEAHFFGKGLKVRVALGG
jgi:hypothetical protein